MTTEIPITEAPRMANMSRRTIERLIAAGELRSFKKAGDRRTYVDLEAVEAAVKRSLQRGLYLRCFTYLPVKYSKVRDKLASALEKARPASHPREIEAVTTRGGRQIEQAGLVWTVPFPLGSTLGAATREVAAELRELASKVREYRDAGAPGLDVQVNLFQA
jgi:hypothetical protein